MNIEKAKASDILTRCFCFDFGAICAEVKAFHKNYCQAMYYISQTIKYFLYYNIIKDYVFIN